VGVDATLAIDWLGGLHIPFSDLYASALDLD